MWTGLWTGTGGWSSYSSSQRPALNILTLISFQNIEITNLYIVQHDHLIAHSAGDEWTGKPLNNQLTSTCRVNHILQ